MVQDQKPATETQMEKSPPQTPEVVAGEGSRNYLMTYVPMYTDDYNPEPYRFSAPGDEEALKLVAEQLEITYPFDYRQFKRAGGKRVLRLNPETVVFPPWG
jgi:hypothetical protein